MYTTMPIKPFNVAKPPTYPSLSISGPTGAGKTTLASTMPGRGLIIDIPTTEGGSFVIPEDRTHRIVGVTMETWEDLADIYKALQTKDDSAFEPFITETWPGLKALNWVCIDSITGMANLAREKVLRDRKETARTPDYQVALNEWGFIGNLVGWEVPKFQVLPYTKIWIAQERTHGGYDDDPGPVQVGPAITRSALALLKPPMTIMGRLSVEGDKERRVLTVGPPGGDYIVKARVLPGKKLPNKIVDPNLGQILRYMFKDGPRPKAFKEAELF